MATAILTRIKRIFLGEVNSTVAKLENPTKIIEQGITELKTKLQGMIDSLVNVKVQYRQLHERIKELEKQNKQIKSRITELKDNNELEKATRMLQLLESNKERLKLMKKDKERLEKVQARLETKITDVKNTIANFEFEKDILTARYETAKTLKELSKDGLNIDVSGTIAHLNEMKKKVLKEEMLSEIYEELEDEFKETSGIKVLSKKELEEKLKSL